MSTTRSVLNEWVNSEVTVVNPQSYIETVLKDSLTMETYKATITEVGEDYVRLNYHASRKKEDLPVNQVIPLHEVKRISLWGDERFLHL